MFTWIKETVNSRFSRRRPPDKSKSNTLFYIGAGHNPTGDKMHLYLFYAKPIMMDLCIRHGDRLDGKRLSEGGPLIDVHLNRCINGSLETAIRDGKIIELTSRTRADAFEEAKGYQLVSNNSGQYCISKLNNKTRKNRKPKRKQ